MRLSHFLLALFPQDGEGRRCGEGRGKSKVPSPALSGRITVLQLFPSRVSTNIIILTQNQPQKGSQPHLYGRALHEEDSRGVVNSGEVLRASEWHHQPRRRRRVEEEGVKFSSRIRHRTMDQASETGILIRVEKIPDVLK